MLRELSRKEKDEYYIISLMCDIKTLLKIFKNIKIVFNLKKK